MFGTFIKFVFVKFYGISNFQQKNVKPNFSCPKGETYALVNGTHSTWVTVCKQLY